MSKEYTEEVIDVHKRLKDVTDGMMKPGTNAPLDKSVVEQVKGDLDGIIDRHRNPLPSPKPWPVKDRSDPSADLE